MYNEEDCIMISGLQHIVFCPRQWGLIHIEQQWEENYLTAEGRQLHERVDSGYKEFRKGIRQYSSLSVRSLKYGIYGIADLVEAIKNEDETGANIDSFGLKGHWTLYPVEFKHGKPKSDNCDKIQLCAQALCLEEMTNTRDPVGAIFYGEIKRRDEIDFTDDLRKETIKYIELAHKLMETGTLPPPKYEKHCKLCSMIDLCMPNKLNKNKLDNYRKALLE
jgi:CRISPR-associated exonuclease Cas4